MSGVLRMQDLLPGDVLLFRCPRLEWSFGAKGVRDTDAVGRLLQTGIHFHELITELDGCRYTHAAVVISVGTGRVRTLNSDEWGVRLAPIDEIRWEYGHERVAVLRAELTPAERSRVREEAVALGQRPKPYPYRDMVPVGHLLSVRNRPLHLPFLDAASNRMVNLAIRQATDSAVLDEVLEWRAETESPNDPPSTGWMCAASVAKVYENADLPLRPALRDPVPKARGRSCFDPVELDAACLTNVAGAIARQLEGDNGTSAPTSGTVRSALGRAARRDQSALTGVRNWTQCLVALEERLSAAGVTTPHPSAAELLARKDLDGFLRFCEAVEDLPIVPELATAFDLEHSELLQHSGELDW